MRRAWPVAIPLAVVAVVVVIAIAGHRSDQRGRRAAAAAPVAASTSTTAAAPSGRATNCIARPAACGYPDPSTTGVPAGLTLKPSGTVSVSTPNTVIRGLDVVGSIEIEADHVTVIDTRITNASPTGHAIRIAPHVRGTVIESTTLRGENSGAGSLANGIQNNGTADTHAARVYAYNLDTAFHGPGSVRDSYFLDNATIAGEHYEPIFYAGGNGPLTVEHSTLLNPHSQTACVFAWTNEGPEVGLRITGNLMAGGGYMIYAGGDSRATRGVTITGNRFSKVYWPRGGFFGVAAYVRAASTASAGNYWDDTLRPAPL